MKLIGGAIKWMFGGTMKWRGRAIKLIGGAYGIDEGAMNLILGASTRLQTY